MKEKQIQIPETLFAEICKYFLFNTSDPEQEDFIKKGLSDKFEANIKRELYTQYKTAATDEEKEKARKEYLDRTGISKKFRY